MIGEYEGLIVRRCVCVDVPQLQRLVGYYLGPDSEFSSDCAALCLCLSLQRHHGQQGHHGGCTAAKGHRPRGRGR